MMFQQVFHLHQDHPCVCCNQQYLQIILKTCLQIVNLTYSSAEAVSSCEYELVVDQRTSTLHDPSHHEHHPRHAVLSLLAPHYPVLLSLQSAFLPSSLSNSKLLEAVDIFERGAEDMKIRSNLIMINLFYNLTKIFFSLSLSNRKIAYQNKLKSNF